MSIGHALAGRKCVVLGAGGFIGINLCRRLLADGADVTGFGHRPRITGTISSVEWVDGEFEDADAVARALDGADLVYHLLGGSSPSASNRDPIAELRGSLAHNLQVVAAAARAKIYKLIFVSSGGTVYGPATRLPIAEDAPTDPISAYGLTKLATEKMLGLYRLIEGLNYAVLRVANPYGPFQLPDRPQGVIATIIKRALDGRPVQIWGDGSVVRDYLHINDVCEALVRAAGITGEHRVFNIGSGIGQSLNDVVRSVSDALDRPVAVDYQPSRPADIPANVLDIGLAEDILHWSPQVAWKAGLQSTAQWLAERPNS